MKRCEETVWVSETGERLLKLEPGEDDVVVITHQADREKARELRDALNDYLGYAGTAFIKCGDAGFEVAGKLNLDDLADALNFACPDSPVVYFVSSDGYLDTYNKCEVKPGEVPTPPGIESPA